MESIFNSPYRDETQEKNVTKAGARKRTQGGQQGTYRQEFVEELPPGSVRVAVFFQIFQNAGHFVSFRFGAPP